tara:strand:- start:7041 stop:8774 length:1734 start_codon:yes stop_codon:yes gene_type:complete
MLLKNREKYIEAAQTKTEKEREERIKSQNSKYRTYRRVMKILKQMKRDGTFEKRSQRLNKLISSISGSSSPQFKLERILFSFSKLKEVDFLVSEMEDAENKVESPKEIQDSIKSSLFEEEVVSTLVASIYSVDADVEEIKQSGILHNLYDELDPPPEIFYLQGEPSKITVVTLDERDTDRIDRYMDIIFKEKLLDISTEPYETKTTLFEVLQELYLDAFGEYPTFMIKSKNIAGFLSGMKSNILRKLGNRETNKEPLIIKPSLQDSTNILPKDKSFTQLIEEKIEILKNQRKMLRLELDIYSKINIEKEMQKYQGIIEKEVEKATKQFDELRQRFSQAKKEKEVLENKKKSMEEAAGKLTASEYVKAKEEIDKVNESLSEFSRILSVLQTEGGNLKRKMEVLGRAGMAEESVRTKVESELYDEFSEQLDNIEELSQTISKLERELSLPKPIKNKIKRVTKKFDANVLEADEYREYITTLTSYERILMQVGRMIGKEIKEMKSYLTKNQNALENTADYFIRLANSTDEEENEENLGIVRRLNRKTLTESDLEEIQENISEALQLRRKIINITEKAKEE